MADDFPDSFGKRPRCIIPFGYPGEHTPRVAVTSGAGLPSPNLAFVLEKRLQSSVGKYPALYYPLYAFLGKSGEQVVKPETRLLIEGYPRSANSFAYTAFVRAQRQGRRKAGKHREGVMEPISIANNLHVPAQVVRASRLGVPALVVIRNPADAVVSFRVRDGIALDLALDYYCSFYETIEPYADDFVLATFEQVTTNFGDVISSLNSRFGTDFYGFRHTNRNVSKVFSRIDGVYEKNYSEDEMESVVSRPSEQRRGLQNIVRRELSLPHYSNRLARAGDVYRRMTGTI